MTTTECKVRFRPLAAASKTSCYRLSSPAVPTPLRRARSPQSRASWRTRARSGSREDCARPDRRVLTRTSDLALLGLRAARPPGLEQLKKFAASGSKLEMPDSAATAGSTAASLKPGAQRTRLRTSERRAAAAAPKLVMRSLAVLRATTTRLTLRPLRGAMSLLNQRCHRAAPAGGGTVLRSTTDKN